MNAFATNLKAGIRAKGITQQELADAVGITQAAVSNYMVGGAMPNGTRLIQLAAALGTTSEALMGDTPLDLAPPPPNPVSEAIRTAMEAKCWNQHDLATASGITDSAITNYVAKGRTPKVEHLQKLAAALAVPVSRLLGAAEPSAQSAQSAGKPSRRPTGEVARLTAENAKLRAAVQQLTATISTLTGGAK